MRKIIDKILENIAVLLITAMICVASWQVLSRYIFKSPSTFSEEFLRFSIIWLSMLGIAYVFGKNQHISIDFLKRKFTIKERFSLELLIIIIFTLFSAVIMIGGGVHAVAMSTKQISPSLGIPMAYVYLSLPVSGIFIILYSILNILDLKNKYNELI
ncbi:TRAP transporter small permease [Cetobacterium somerae]|uniref:TRAP transporter small permease n=1 Tax=Cetobacterium somerae TaxID=188913 RepID=UPI003892C8ED